MRNKLIKNNDAKTIINGFDIKKDGNTPYLILQKKEYDLWSMGCILIEILYNNDKFNNYYNYHVIAKSSIGVDIKMFSNFIMLDEYHRKEKFIEYFNNIFKASDFKKLVNMENAIFANYVYTFFNIDETIQKKYMDKNNNNYNNKYNKYNKYKNRTQSNLGPQTGYQMPIAGGNKNKTNKYKINKRKTKKKKLIYI